MPSEQTDALLTLTLASGFAPGPTQRAIDGMGGPQCVINASADQLARVARMPLSRARRVRQAINEVIESDRLDHERELMARLDVHAVAMGDPTYPRLLKLIDDPPPLIYVRGELREEDAIALAVVGARRCTQYGREQAKRLAGLAAQCGLCIVSGGAYGIDAAAHRAAMGVGGRTIAVLGSGLAEPYPKDHIELFDRIADANGGRGAVISELPMTSPPQARNFPARNRIISGLSLGVLVVEAALRSGALVTARLAVEEHHREVMAVPGRVDSAASAGCHKLIREGSATLVTCLDDILNALGEMGETLKAQLPEKGAELDDKQPGLFDQNLTPTQQRILASLDGDALLLDQIAMATGLAAPLILADLTMLQVRGLIKTGGGKWRRVKR